MLFLLPLAVSPASAGKLPPLIKAARAEVSDCLLEAREPKTAIEWELETISTCFVSGSVRDVHFYQVSVVDGAETWVATVRLNCDKTVMYGECAVEAESEVCEVDGVNYEIGDSWTDADGCNTCFCGDDGLIGCTRMMCGGGKLIELP